LVGALEGREAAPGSGLAAASVRDVMDEDDVDMESEDDED
jgi:ribonuclease P/MRP protein subunit POP5